MLAGVNKEQLTTEGEVDVRSGGDRAETGRRPGGDRAETGRIQNPPQIKIYATTDGPR